MDKKSNTGATKIELTMQGNRGNISKKLRHLKEIVSNMEGVLIAYSGGVDSTFVLKVAKDVLGDRVLAVTANSALYPSEELEAAKSLAQKFGVTNKIIETRELSNPRFIVNPIDRCYWCKRELFAELASIAREYDLKYTLDGTNFDDLNDFRPGMKAAHEFGVRSPLKEAKLTKEDVRSLSKRLGLPTWDKPSFACLASRFPYGTKIAKKDLLKVTKAERFLGRLGFTQVRVRHHDTIARVEVSQKDIPIFLEERIRLEISSYLKKLGYSYAALDLEGYRTGSMNEVLTGDDKR